MIDISGLMNKLKQSRVFSLHSGGAEAPKARNQEANKKEYGTWKIILEES